ncbi:MAG: HAMP domain-containing histidine kinase [Ignavibacteriales bacterium]|nr:HAMP domain-containing histidine kinase [Ignavibacteriales bacterium]
MTYKNRIATHYLISAASVIAVVFVIIYFIVKTTVFSNLDTALLYESNKHLNDIVVNQDSIKFNKNSINYEREHQQAEVIPFFLQIVNIEGQLLDKSRNLKQQLLSYYPNHTDAVSFNSTLNDRLIRQVQIPIKKNDATLGYLITAVSLERTKNVVDNLRFVLLTLFPLILVVLFFITRYLAGKSIQPIVNITNTTNLITKSNLSQRVELPETKDELFTLSESINSLLKRIETAFTREKQFTHDASHELRTPLSVIKGTLEVLIRKPREREYYEDQIKYCISEINNMSERVDQLLLLARLDNSSIKLRKENMPIIALIDSAIHHQRKLIEEKNIKIIIEDESNLEVFIDPYYSEIIIENIISNAVKYSKPSGQIIFRAVINDNKKALEIIDFGLGINEKDLDSVFNPFFRSDALVHKEIQGSGLGLSIVKKSADLLGIEVKLQNNPEGGIKSVITF